MPTFVQVNCSSDDRHIQVFYEAPTDAHRDQLLREFRHLHLIHHCINGSLEKWILAGQHWPAGAAHTWAADIGGYVIVVTSKIQYVRRETYPNGQPVRVGDDMTSIFVVSGRKGLVNFVANRYKTIATYDIVAGVPRLHISVANVKGLRHAILLNKN